MRPPRAQPAGRPGACSGEHGFRSARSGRDQAWSRPAARGLAPLCPPWGKRARVVWIWAARTVEVRTAIRRESARLLRAAQRRGLYPECDAFRIQPVELSRWLGDSAWGLYRRRVSAEEAGTRGRREGHGACSGDGGGRGGVAGSGAGRGRTGAPPAVIACRRAVDSEPGGHEVSRISGAGAPGARAATTRRVPS
jgi:hypothetical protein